MLQTFLVDRNDNVDNRVVPIELREARSLFDVLISNTVTLSLVQCPKFQSEAH